MFPKTFVLSDIFYFWEETWGTGARGFIKDFSILFHAFTSAFNTSLGTQRPPVVMVVLVYVHITHYLSPRVISFLISPIKPNGRRIHYHSSTAFTVCAFYLLSSSLSSSLLLSSLSSSSNTNTTVVRHSPSAPPSAYQLLRVIPGQRNRYVVHLYASSSANSPFSRFVRLTVSLTTTVCPPTTPDIMLCEEPCRSRQQHFANHIKVTEARQ